MANDTINRGASIAQVPGITMLPGGLSTGPGIVSNSTVTAQSFHILTEGGDFLTTEGGDRLEQEAGP